MQTLSFPFFPTGAFVRQWLAASFKRVSRPRPWLELRIDVEQQPEDIEGELEALRRRLYTPGDALYDLPVLADRLPGFVLRYREADGEHYVYVEDVARGRLAGYTVFNRLIEVNRRADRYLRAPHSKYARDYQGRGLATAVYEFALGTGFCLVSGARQSVGAHALWRALARRHRLGFVSLHQKKLRYLGAEVSAEVHDDLHTRMILLGRGWTVERLQRQAGAEISGACEQPERRVARVAGCERVGHREDRKGNRQDRRPGGISRPAGPSARP